MPKLNHWTECRSLFNCQSNQTMNGLSSKVLIGKRPMLLTKPMPSQVVVFNTISSSGLWVGRFYFHHQNPFSIFNSVNLEARY
ncbi:FAD-linked oxidoreductase ZEB1 [Fusarium oxysporum f. sp. albedinis]|nr:FAD-linked oxidoreductase ZEB1 [Fusarium oxysporum f. sp. albedinis]